MEPKTNCPVCDSKLLGWNPHGGSTDDEEFGCPLCGEYVASFACIADLPAILGQDPEASIRISHALRNMQRQNKMPFLGNELADKFSRLELPRPREQADNLVRWMGEHGGQPGTEMELHPANLKAVVGAPTDEGFGLVVGHLFDTGILKGYMADSMGQWGVAMATLSFEGWDYYEELMRGEGVHGRAFMAMQYGEEVLNGVIKDHLAPQVLEAGFKLVRLDEEPRAGLIDNRMRVEIQNSDFIVADLSHRNPGAYWEAGYAEGLGKPVFYTCQKSVFEEQRTHFDTNHHYTVIWDDANPSAAGEELKLAIRATLPHLARMAED